MHGTRAERGKPVVLLIGGKWTVRPIASIAGTGGGKKRKPVCNRLDRGCNIPHAKAGRLPSGL